MFKHVDDDNDCNDNNVDVEDDEEEDCENEETDEIVNDQANETFVNPSQVEKTNAIDKDEVLIYKCDLCDEYEAPTQTQIENHRFDKHPLHCCVCSKLFPSKTQNRKHLEKEHMDGRKLYSKFN